ncbi:putative 3-methyladenine DNA glycosylase [Planctomycetia bacterium]|nr:putative 3-methyladenine DNA glycosylase [Planctomycetia bacterium]
MTRRTGPLPAPFFDRPADRVARDLLGASLVVRAADGGVTRHLVHEVEGYLGGHDLACHGSKGMTARNAVMFGPAGRWYVYLCYGMHWMLNVVTGPPGVPAAVLIRGAGEFVGPGRLTRGLGIDRRIDGRTAGRAAGLWFEAAFVPVPRRLIERTPRIGVGYAGDWADAPLRFVVDAEKLTTLTVRSEVTRRSSR